MKKHYIIGLLLTFVLVVTIAVTYGSKTAKALPSYFMRSPETYVATTTAFYMTAGTATTTYPFNTWDIDKSDVFINATASTTAATLNWKYEYSNNNVDWFGEDAYTVTSNILYTHASTTVVHSRLLNNATASTTRFVVTFSDIASNFKRIVFSLPVGSTNASVWAEATLKSNAQ